MIRLTAIAIACVFACPRSAAAVPGLIKQLEAGQPQKVVLYGTSLTAGGAWVPQLSSALNAQYPGQITWVNAGMSGRASNSGVANLATKVLAENPDAVFIEFGMNDAFTDYAPGDIDRDITPAQLKANLQAMIDAILAQRPSCEIVLQTMNPAWDAPNGNQSGTKRPNLAAYYQGYRDIALERGLRLVDNYATWLKLQANDENLFEAYVADGTHPNATGLQRFVTPVIRSVLGADNGLALLVDPATGRAVFQNQSAAEIELVGYTIASAGGALRTTWNGLAKQGLADWFEANPTTSNLSELSPTGSLPVPARAAIDLGVAWNASGMLDMLMNYQTADGTNHVGLVAFTPTAAAVTTLAGDYNHDGSADAADYVAWRNTLGASVANGTNADGSGNGIIDTGDYANWAAHFGSLTTAAAAAMSFAQSVPEPSACVLVTTVWLMAAGRPRILAANRRPPATLPLSAKPDH